MLNRLLAHPLTRGVDIDDPETTNLRRVIVQQKEFLRKVYERWYSLIVNALPGDNYPILELGSGAGFLQAYVANLIASEIFICDGINAVLNGLFLPLKQSSLGGIVMIDVLHHLPDPPKFFAEAARCVRPDGSIIMIEPWVTPWSKIIYTKLHHERFDWKTPDWKFSSSGPLSGANGALPYIIFSRDRARFEREFPMWKIESNKPIMPVLYLLSGGISLRALVPGWSFELWSLFERIIEPLNRYLGMFCIIKLVRMNDNL